MVTRLQYKLFLTHHPKKKTGHATLSTPHWNFFLHVITILLDVDPLTSALFCSPLNEEILAINVQYFIVVPAVR